MVEEPMKEAAALLVKLTGQPVRSFFTNEFGRDRDTRGLSVIVEGSQALSLVLSLRANLPAGLLAFIGTTRWYGDEEHDGVEVVVATGGDQFDILRLGCAAGDLPLDDLIQKLQEYDERYGVTITHAETDTVEFKLGRPPDDAKAMAAELYDLCPDIVDQGIGSLEALEEYLTRRTELFLWWD